MFALICFASILRFIYPTRPPSLNNESKPIFVDTEATMTIPKSSQERDADYQAFLESAAATSKATKARLEAIMQAAQGQDNLKAMLSSTKSSASAIADSIALNLQRKDLVMIETMSLMTSESDAQLAPAWWAAIAIIIVFLGIPLLFMCLFPHEVMPAPFVGGKKPMNRQGDYHKAPGPEPQGHPGYGFDGRSTSIGTPEMSSMHGSAPPGAVPISPFTAAMSANMPFVESLRSPASAARAVWGATDGPPPLCAAIAPAQSATSFYVDKSAMRTLYNHGRMEIMDRYSKVAAYATLAHSAGGTRLVVACEPSCSDPVATVGPLDFPANLDPGAMLHGPHREVYGAFERYGEGFSVSHFSRMGHVFTSTPKKVVNGLVVEICAGSTQLASAWIMAYKGHCQIDVNAGLDITLMLIAVLATCVASPHVIDQI